jgi:hypothetical protein
MMFHLMISVTMLALGPITICYALSLRKMDEIFSKSDWIWGLVLGILATLSGLLGILVAVMVP